MYLRCFDWIFIILHGSLVIPAFTLERFCKGDGEPGALVSQRRRLCLTNVPLMCLIKAHWTVVPVAFDSGRITRDYNRIRCPHSVCLIIHNKVPQGIKVNRASIFFCRLTSKLFYHYDYSHRNDVLTEYIIITIYLYIENMECLFFNFIIYLMCVLCYY